MVLLRLRHVLVFKVLVLGCANVSAITTLAPAVPSVTLNNGVSMPIIALGTGGYLCWTTFFVQHRKCLDFQNT